MERVLAAAEELLADKPFDQITISEIATRSATSPTSIYARFTDKTALLLAVHERFKQRTEARIAAAVDHPRRATLPPEEFLGWAARDLVATYHTHRQLLRSALLADSDVLYARAAELGAAVSAALAQGLARHVDEADARAAERSLDFAVRAAMALVQQDLLFRPQRPTRFSYPVKELVERIAQLLSSAIAPYLK